MSNESATQEPSQPLESFSQNGEDRIAWEYLGASSEGFFVEVGANDPVLLSQTWFFEQRGWRGILVEPQPHMADKLRQVRKGSVVVEAGAGSPAMSGTATLKETRAHAWSYIKGEPNQEEVIREVEVAIRTLDAIFEELGVERIDLLSIDTEGMEIDVLNGLDLQRWQPRLIFLEDHLDDLELFFYMRRRGYRLVHRTGVNAWWIPRGAPRPSVPLRQKLSLWNALLFKQPKKRARWILRKLRKQ